MVAKRRQGGWHQASDVGLGFEQSLGVLQAHRELSRDHTDGSKKRRRAGACFLLRSNGNISEWLLQFTSVSWAFVDLLLHLP